MGHRKQNAPRHGSLRYMPRKRANHIKGRVRNWLEVEDKNPLFLGFAGFKSGMTHIAYIEDQKTNPFFGKELMKPVTIIETPPLVLFGVKVYEKSEYGLKCKGELLNTKLNKELARKISLPNPESYDFDQKKQELEKIIDSNSIIRGLFHTQPYKASVPRIKPDIIEIMVSGGSTPDKQFKFALEHLGKDIRVRDVFSEGELIDAIGVSKGKGFQGPVKKFGIKLLPRKTRGTKRGVGCIGPWHPSRVMYTVPRAGQMGFHQRTEYNKRIVKISETGDEINPKGGFLHYGLVKGDFIAVLGSVPGPKKRLIRIRKSMRPKKNFEVVAPTITYISRQTQQGK
ncbi:MAG: 50S ribosomal protein L3 [Candidatus Lokiarchaeota archaeon]|nr:50S ribosomal protein L3 [Candidatus Lokiarchaeota archaeon]